MLQRFGPLQHKTTASKANKALNTTCMLYILASGSLRGSKGAEGLQLLFSHEVRDKLILQR